MGVLERVSSPEDLRRLRLPELKELAAEIRSRIVETTARQGGHTAPNLGVVELTLALHYVFDTPRDRVVWDVGHQCYAHKLVTGRATRFETLRLPGGISGFPKRAESEFDVFDTGHSGDSISAALGMAVGDAMQGERRRTVAVIGDGSIASGIAFEGLNHAGALKRDLVVILNDNEMSIGPSMGAMAGYLNRVITGRMYNRLKADAWNLLGHLPRELSRRARGAARKLEEGLKNLVVPSLLFEELGFRYLGPVDGHNLVELISTFRRVRELRGPVLVHVVTKKGKGFAPAEREPERFHGTGPFDPATGAALVAPGMSFTQALGQKLVELAARDRRVVALTAGMCLGTGLVEFRERYPDRFFDVGICEQHAVTFAAGLALAGMRPVVAVYSTFLARAVDQVIQDVCLQGLPVVFAVDRAGVVGEDGPTHHGFCDLSYLTMIPGLTVGAPRDEEVLGRMLEYAVLWAEGPVALRYPRGGSGVSVAANLRADDPAGRYDHGPTVGKAEILREGRNGAIVAVGSCVWPALDAAEELAREGGPDLTVVDVCWVKPLDTDLMARLASSCDRILTVEENVKSGGLGSAVTTAVERLRATGQAGAVVVGQAGLPDMFLPQGKRLELLDEAGLAGPGLKRRLVEFFAGKRQSCG
uniref:1-deoxy-D-xylulose-5-phosphate synthase n=1 Tax=candidate division WOR-3 bacterium TaxID=2052148 RepID=A0A7C4G948_UNCW3